jgi:hypothetical protein
MIIKHGVLERMEKKKRKEKVAKRKSNKRKG